ncbi:unnamed protein product [Adineta steineri]|uniref:Ankyrin repeat protein n=1 Tax=Adineta steineri TaxID=433720 RepID=A0A820BS07_9BILA|nr:unnamed protein product [Adineta steineri]
MKLNEEIQKNALLHNAIMKDYEHIFLLLLKSGFSPNTLLSDHKTPLSIAVVSNNLSPTKQSNYSIMYTYFRDYLLSNYCDQGQVELNAGLQNALFNWCLPIATDLLEYGAIIDALKRIDSLENFFSQIAVTFFKERRSIAYIDPFISCFIQILLHNIPSLLSTRKIRQSMIKLNQKNIEQLHLNPHLKNMFLTSK